MVLLLVLLYLQVNMSIQIKVGKPTSGGIQSISDLIDYNPISDFKSINIQNSIEVASDTMNITFYGGQNNSVLPAPLAGNEIIVLNGGNTEFAGIISEVHRTFSNELTGNFNYIYECSCKDYVYFLNRRLVNNVYTLSVINSLLGGTPLTAITAGSIFKAILIDLFNDSNSDIHYQFFKNNLNLISDGPELREMTFDRVTPSQAFDSISQASGMIWDLDYSKQVSLRLINTFGAPVSSLDVTTNLDYFDWNESEIVDDIATELILRDIKRASVGFTVDDPKGSVGRSHNGNENKIFYFNRTPFSPIDIAFV